MPTLNFSDHEQTSRNDYSNYDSLVGSLKSDTLICHDQQATVSSCLFSLDRRFSVPSLESDEEATDAESEMEMERALTLQKEQVNDRHVFYNTESCEFQIRALQGQQRALLALKRRSEQRLVEQQQLAMDRTSTADENDLLSDIRNLRNRYVSHSLSLLATHRLMTYRLQLLRDRYEQKQRKK